MLADGGFAKRPAESFDLRAPELLEGFSVALGIALEALQTTRTATYDFIRKHYGDAVAVEMEGHGFLLGVRMNHPVQGIVVRGISDQIGDKNPDSDRDWQPVAARHAAAFAFQILSKMPGIGGQPSLTVQLDEEWQSKHLHDAAATAGPRYSAELRVGTPLHDIFEALCRTNSWFASLRPRNRKLRKAIKWWSDAVNTKDGRAWSTPFPEHLRKAGLAATEGLQAISHGFARLVERQDGVSPASIGDAESAVLPSIRELHAALREDLEACHGEGTADSASFRQFQAEYQCCFPAANVDSARDLVAMLEELEAWSRSGVGRAAGKRGILLTGVAGVGKTHAICDIARDRYQRGLYTVVLFGEQFTSTDEPWDRMRQVLGFGPIARDELLAALDAAGEKSGGHLLMCIDGLNESRPRDYWRRWLSSLATQVARYEHIRLCVSCRSTYERMVVPEGHGLERIEHVGFAGMENTACRQFFAHYGLEPLVAPSFHPELSQLWSFDRREISPPLPIAIRFDVTRTGNGRLTELSKLNHLVIQAPDFPGRQNDQLHRQEPPID